MAREGEILSILMVLSLLQLHCKIAHVDAAPTTYNVGDDLGWTAIVSMETWPEGKNFYAGDILVFTYDHRLNNVAVLEQKGHDLCSLTENARVYHSGNDKIPLAFGANYFIDTHPADCQLGMKMAINATAPPPQ